MEHSFSDISFRTNTNHCMWFNAYHITTYIHTCMHAMVDTESQRAAHLSCVLYYILYTIHNLIGALYHSGSSMFVVVAVTRFRLPFTALYLVLWPQIWLNNVFAGSLSNAVLTSKWCSYAWGDHVSCTTRWSSLTRGCEYADQFTGSTTYTELIRTTSQFVTGAPLLEASLLRLQPFEFECRQSYTQFHGRITSLS